MFVYSAYFTYISPSEHIVVFSDQGRTNLDKHTDEIQRDENFHITQANYYRHTFNHAAAAAIIEVTTLYDNHYEMSTHSPPEDRYL